MKNEKNDVQKVFELTQIKIDPLVKLYGNKKLSNKDIAKKEGEILIELEFLRDLLSLYLIENSDGNSYESERAKIMMKAFNLIYSGDRTGFLLFNSQLQDLYQDQEMMDSDALKYWVDPAYIPAEELAVLKNAHDCEAYYD